jgi:hypothetical protein
LSFLAKNKPCTNGLAYFAEGKITFMELAPDEFKVDDFLGLF